VARQVGAQNAGKSSLINAMRKSVGRGGASKEITTAPLPGTTLGTVPRPEKFTSPGVFCMDDTVTYACKPTTYVLLYGIAHTCVKETGQPNCLFCLHIRSCWDQLSPCVESELSHEEVVMHLPTEERHPFAYLSG
jgi:hypothetical protein